MSAEKKKPPVEKIEKRTNLANLLTALRLVLSPVFVFIYLGSQSFWAAVACLAIAILNELTDLFDGMVARYRNEVTDFGKILDPLADSISRLTVFFCFTQDGWAPLYLVIFLFYRDSMVATLRTFCAYRGVVVSARKSGKLKAWVQAITILLILFFRAVIFYTDEYAALLHKIGYVAVLITVLYTVFSAVDYIAGNWKHLREHLHRSTM